MKKRNILLALGFGLALLAPAAPPSAAADAVAPVQSFGDWHLRCREIVKGGPDVCKTPQKLGGPKRTTDKKKCVGSLFAKR